ncbi:hypothetical protein CRE_18185 [Caenorhabditis remanei]|uniref:Serpentine Receptor, class Z n=1 Tax=Caenorhabditis remanei TaxID=31234 RepID=E3N8L5_CAERE|nr:hypothetical protein CRE_18185 [Caenorhabditis remanei]
MDFTYLYSETFENGTSLITAYNSIFFWTLSALYTILDISVFPFYLYVYKLNRERDKATAVFPIVNHFYKMIIFIYFMFFVLVSIMFYAMFIEADPYSWTAGIEVAFLFLTLAILQIVSEVNQFLLSLLAIQRFFLYFFSGSTKYVPVSEKTMSWIIKMSYGFFLLEGGVLFFQSGHGKIYFFAGFYISLNVILLISAALYVPMVISLKKLMHLTSSSELSQPQRYVLLQLVVIATVMLCKLTDAILMPLVIQISYLGCNRHNLQTLLTSKQLFVCNCSCVSRRQIHPSHDSNSRDSTPGVNV